MSTNSEALEFNEWITFSVGNERYAINVENVKEIKVLSELSPIPGSPDHVIGAFKLRGDIVTVVSGSQLLGLDRFNEIKDLKEMKVIIALVDQHFLGLCVDEVHEIVRFSEQQIDMNTQKHSQSGLVLGTIRLNNRLIIPIKLNGSFLLSSEES